MSDPSADDRQQAWLTEMSALLLDVGVEVDKADLMSAASSWTDIFKTRPQTLVANVVASATLLGLTKAQFVAAALKQPQIFCQKPETLRSNVTASARLLGFTKLQFVTAALRHPPLFYQKSETLNGNVTANARLFGVAKSQFVKAALKQPTLFSLKPETLDGNVTASADLFGITKLQFVTAALKQPQLFYQKPETLDGKVTASAKLLGITKPQFVAAALKQPQLFYQNPEVLFSKKPYLVRIAASLGDPDTFLETVLKIPVALSCGRNRLHACYVLAKLKLKKGKTGTLIVFPAAKTSVLIRDYFSAQIATTGRGQRALRVMHAQGIIDALPVGISAIARPPHRPGHAFAAPKA